MDGFRLRENFVLLGIVMVFAISERLRYFLMAFNEIVE